MSEMSVDREEKLKITVFMAAAQKSRERNYKENAKANCLERVVDRNGFDSRACRIFSDCFFAFPFLIYSGNSE